jgi:septal ring factor EnvC (AmiA/AmiB activator)
MEAVKLAGTITLFTFLFALAAWCSARPPHHTDSTLYACPSTDRNDDDVRRALELLKRDVDDMDKRVSSVIDALVGSRTPIERDAAKAKLQELQRAKYELEKRLAEAKANFARAERRKRATIVECQSNPLRKECIYSDDFGNHSVETVSH